MDVTGKSAVARVEIHRDGKHVFTDYLSLYQFADGWKIVAKIFQSVAARRERWPTPPGLVRAIGRWDLTAAVVNGVIGALDLQPAVRPGRPHRAPGARWRSSWPGWAC